MGWRIVDVDGSRSQVGTIPFYRVYELMDELASCVVCFFWGGGDRLMHLRGVGTWVPFFDDGPFSSVGFRPFSRRADVLPPTHRPKVNAIIFLAP
jgi:hypothetical protein